MSAAHHRRGTSLPNQVRDRDAALRMGCSSSRTDVHPDDDPAELIHPTPWPEVDPVRHADTSRVCPVDGAPLLPNGLTDWVSCAFCGKGERLPDEVDG